MIVLFFYLHIYYHLKRSNDLDIYTIDNPSKDRLEEICNLRQPVLFNFMNERLLESCSLNNLENNYSAFDIKIRNVKNNDDNSELYVPFLLKEAFNLFQTDSENKFITENNEDFLMETGVIKNFKYNDSFLRPPLVSNCNYDLLSGSINCKTPLRYNLDFRNFYFVTTGSVTIKLIPPRNSKYLYQENDYENFEFISPIDPWNVQDKYKADFDKVKTLDITLNKGNILYIPAYWWYSIKYDKLSSICCFKYKTYMNNVAILPELLMSALQKQNVKREIVPSILQNDNKLNKDKPNKDTSIDLSNNETK